MGLKYRSTNSLSRHGGLAELQDASVWKVPNLYVDERLLGLVNRESGFFCEERMSPFWGGDVGILAGGAPGTRSLFLLQSGC